MFQLSRKLGLMNPHYETKSLALVPQSGRNAFIQEKKPFGILNYIWKRRGKEHRIPVVKLTLTGKMFEVSQTSRKMTEDLENNFITAQRMPTLKEKK